MPNGINPPFRWPEPKHRRTYDEVWQSHLDGLLSIGLLWEIAQADEVFRRYVINKGLPKL